MSDIIGKAKVVKQSYQLEVKIIYDELTSYVEFDDIELIHNPVRELESSTVNTLHQYSNSALDHCSMRFVALVDDEVYSVGNVLSIKDAYSKLGYSRNNAYLKALNQVKETLKILEGFVYGDWHYVGIAFKVNQTMTDSDGLVWSREVVDESLWGIEWGCGVCGLPFDNLATFVMFMKEMLPQDLLAVFENDLEDLYHDLD